MHIYLEPTYSRYDCLDSASAISLSWDVECKNKYAFMWNSGCVIYPEKKLAGTEVCYKYFMPK